MAGGDMIILNKNAGEWVEDEARRLGVSVSLICREAKISRSTVRRWKVGDHEPQMSLVRQISRFIEENGDFLSTNRSRAG